MANGHKRKRWTVYAFRRRAEPQRVYVGITTDLRGRLRAHFRDEITEKPAGIVGAFARRVPKPLAILRRVAADTRITVLAWDIGRVAARVLELDHIERFRAAGCEVANVAVEVRITPSGKRVTGAPGRRAGRTNKVAEQYPIGPVNPLAIFATARQRVEAQRRRDLHRALVGLLDPWADRHSETLPTVAEAVRKPAATVKDGMEHAELSGATFNPGGRGRGNAAKFTREGTAVVSIKDNVEQVELSQRECEEDEQVKIDAELLRAVKAQEAAADGAAADGDEDYSPVSPGDLMRSHTALFGEAEAPETTITRRVEIAAVTLFKINGLNLSLATVVAWVESCRKTRKWPKGDAKVIRDALRRYDRDGRTGTTDSRAVQLQLRGGDRSRGRVLGYDQSIANFVRDRAVL